MPCQQIQPPFLKFLTCFKMSLFASGVIILYVVTNEIITTFFAKRLFDISGKIKCHPLVANFD
jgi:hypothetical protein